MRKLSFKSPIIQILIHSLAWSFIIFAPFLVFSENVDNHRLYESLRRNAITITFFYINAFIFIPKFLTKKKFWLYFSSVFVSFIIIIILSALGEYIFKEKFHLEKDDFLMRISLKSFFSTLFIFGLSTSYKITNEWFITERQKKDIENERLTSELAFLKSQLNPHFLFNSLNNIYSLAYKKSDDAPEAIVKLSQLMRYMLYESNAEKVLLHKEIEYLVNYIELQKLRLYDNVTILFDVEGEIEGKLIEPLILVPFVENAFKHGISNTETCDIIMKLECVENKLMFFVKNKIHKTLVAKQSQSSGIGLNNVTRRLQLLYPDRHQVIINETEEDYTVELTLAL